MGYAGSVEWRADVDRAKAAWKVMTEAIDPGRVVYVTAEAETGSRYAVVVTILPQSQAADEHGSWPLDTQPDGGSVLISVIQPWQTAWCIGVSGPLDTQYIADRFLRHGATAETTHGGDLAAVLLTVNYALGKVFWK